MLLTPYDNMSIELGNTAIVSFYKRSDKDEKGEKREASYALNFGTPDSMSIFSEEAIQGLKGGIDAYNKKGGNFYALFNNVYINLDIVNSVARYGKTLRVVFAGGVWESGETDSAQEIYKGYLKYAQARQEKLQIAFEAVSIIKPKPDKESIPEFPKENFADRSFAKNLKKL